MAARNPRGDYDRALKRWQREYWLTTLRIARGGIREAARIAGVSPATAHRMVKKCGITFRRDVIG